jgi:hypothetical protein
MQSLGAMRVDYLQAPRQVLFIPWKLILFRGPRVRRIRPELEDKLTELSSYAKRIRNFVCDGGQKLRALFLNSLNEFGFRVSKPVNW